MTTSQSKAEASMGFIINETYGLLDESGTTVIAVIIWGNDRLYVWAQGEEVSDQVPSVPRSRYIDRFDAGEEWFEQMTAAGRMVYFFDDVVPAHRGVLQVEDFRPGVGKPSYIIYTGNMQRTTPRLVPRVVYYEQARTGAPRGSAPRLESYDEVLALTRSDAAVWISNVDGLEGKGLNSPEAVAVFGDLSRALRVFDLYAMTQPS